MSKLKPAATLTVHHISRMSKGGIKRIVAFLKEQARIIKQHHQKPGFAARYTARYLYR